MGGGNGRLTLESYPAALAYVCRAGRSSQRVHAGRYPRTLCVVNVGRRGLVRARIVKVTSGGGVTSASPLEHPSNPWKTVGVARLQRTCTASSISAQIRCKRAYTIKVYYYPPRPPFSGYLFKQPELIVSLSHCLASVGNLDAVLHHPRLPFGPSPLHRLKAFDAGRG